MEPAKSLLKRAHYRAIKNWLSNYKPQQGASNFDSVKGYLEACHHFFELKEWQQADKILDAKIDTSKGDDSGKEGLGKQLGIWGYYQKQLELYTKLSGKLCDQKNAFSSIICGTASRFLGDFDKSEKYLNYALAIYRKTGDKEKCAEIWHDLGLLHADRGEDNQAFLCYRKSLRIHKQIKNYRGVANTLHDISRIATNRNKYRQAQKLHRRIESIYDNYLRDDKEQESYAWLLYNIGRFWADQNENIEAERYTLKSLQLFKELDLKIGVSYAYYSLGILMLNLKNTKSAYNYCQKALKLFKESNNLGGVASTLHILGRTAFKMPDFKLAEKCYRELIKITNSISGKFYAFCYCIRGVCTPCSFPKSALSRRITFRCC